MLVHQRVPLWKSIKNLGKAWILMVKSQHGPQIWSVDSWGFSSAFPVRLDCKTYRARTGSWHFKGPNISTIIYYLALISCIWQSGCSSPKLWYCIALQIIIPMIASGRGPWFKLTTNRVSKQKTAACHNRFEMAKKKHCNNYYLQANIGTKLDCRFLTLF